MKRRLFLTGPIGCGKSTAISRALGEKITQCGGFLTRRYRVPQLHFRLESPDGQFAETFLDFSGEKPRLNRNVFSQLGVHLLKGDILVLDEIGGIELLCPEFATALAQVFQKDVPIIGVLKGQGSADSLIETLRPSEEYMRSADQLRNWLRNDENTLLYECGQFDERAILLAKQWAEENLHDRFF